MEKFGYSYSVIDLPAGNREAAQTLVILGLSQGGASEIAGLLRRMGLHLGNEIDEASSEDTEIIAAAHPVSDLIDPNAPNHASAKAKLTDLIAKKNKDAPSWGWKDARAALYLPLIFDALVNPKIVAVFSDYCKIATGEHQNFGRDHLKSMEDAHRIYGAILECLQSLKAPKMIVSYEQAIRHPVEATTALAQFTQAPIVETDIPRIARYLDLSDTGKA